MLVTIRPRIVCSVATYRSVEKVPISVWLCTSQTSVKYCYCKLSHLYLVELTKTCQRFCDLMLIWYNICRENVGERNGGPLRHAAVLPPGLSSHLHRTLPRQPCGGSFRNAIYWIHYRFSIRNWTCPVLSHTSTYGTRYSNVWLLLHTFDWYQSELILKILNQDITASKSQWTNLLSCSCVFGTVSDVLWNLNPPSIHL